MCLKQRNCDNCGRFMEKYYVQRSNYDPCIYQWWKCHKCDLELPEVIYDRTPQSLDKDERVMSCDHNWVPRGSLLGVRTFG